MEQVPLEDSARLPGGSDRDSQVFREEYKFPRPGREEGHSRQWEKKVQRHRVVMGLGL